jgi:hypothetical protein
MDVVRFGACTRPWMLAVCLLGCSSNIATPGEGADPDPDLGPGQDQQHAGADPTIPELTAVSVARRLSRAEIDRSLRDLVGDETAPATRLLAEDLYAPYDNDVATQTASSALIDSLEGMASDVAARVVGDAALRDRLVPCKPAAAGDAACFRRVVEGFGRRAFRRPLAPAETDAYLELLEYATEANPDVPHDFYTAVELFLRSVLQDPEFLYRIEHGTELDDFAIAARMSYLLWGSTPDDELLAAADAGHLRDSDERRAQAERMQGDARAREQVHRFHAMWLGYRALPHPPELSAAFQRETNALIDRIVFEQPQSYLGLFTAEQTYLDDALADHYGLSHPAGGQGWVDYGGQRAGILSHGSVLSAFSKFSDTSPTQRGIFVRTRLLCQPVQPPPPNVNSDNPPGNKDAVCKSERYAEHRSSSACAGCHAQLDPIGFGLEQYDMAGRFRSHDEDLPQCAIDGQGSLPGHGDFSGPAELGALLVKDDLVADCMVRQFYQFAVGRTPEASEQPAIVALSQHFAENDYRLADLVIDYVASEAFALRREPETP